MNNFETPVYEKGYPDYDAVNRKDEESFDEFANFIMNEVSDEKIEDLFFEMGIDIDLNKPWTDDEWQHFGKVLETDLKDKLMREKLINAFVSHAKGHVDKHLANVEVYLTNPAGIGEHPDIMEAIEAEMKIVAEYDDLLEMVDKYLK